jgi:tetratricopeptide (TPR) repeat protein
VFSIWQFTAGAQVKKEGKFKKVWHNMVAHYNIYFNGEQKLLDALETLEEGHKDDFGKVIEVFPEGDEAASKGIFPKMDEIQVKTSKVIQKYPKCKWVDNSWMLMGKSYFYKYDLFAALEVFQFVYGEYPRNEIRFEAQLWVLKTYIRQNKLNDAESILGLINQEIKFPKKLQKTLLLTAANLYIKEKKYKQASEMMVKVLPLMKKRNEKYRVHFILGQLYFLQSNYKKSYYHYEKTVKLNPPYDYAFQANLGMSRMLILLPGSTAKSSRKYLKRMLNDDKNIDFFDEIFYELANLEKGDGNLPGAIQYYRMSAWSSTKNTNQKANSYLALANIFFEAKNYSLAQTYFDSTAAFISEEHVNYDQIIARQNVLSDLIMGIVTIETQDSLLLLSKMDKSDLDRMIERKAQKERDAEEQKKRKEDNANNIQGTSNQSINKQGQSPPTGMGNDWYFYNPTSLSRGFTDFTRKWGNRKLTDNWRIAAKSKEIEIEKTKEDEPEKKEKVDQVSYDPSKDQEQQNAIKDVSKDLQKYYTNIPFSDQAKVVAHLKIEKAIFQTAKVYHESLKEYEMAISYYESLLSKYPGSDLEAETYFNLIKCYDQIGNKVMVAKYSKILNEKYPKSSFNMVINNKDVLENKGEGKEILEAYNSMYVAFKAGNYQEAKQIKIHCDKKHAGNSLQAKFDYLYALCVAKTDSLSRYLDLLRNIKETYPGTLVANTSDNTLEYFNKRDNKNKISFDSAAPKYFFAPETNHYYLLIFEGVNSDKVKIAYSDYNERLYKNKNLQIVATLLGESQMLVVKSFTNKKDAELYYVEFIKNGSFFDELGLKKYDNLYISEANFKVLLADKKQDNYFEFFTTNYIE